MSDITVLVVDDDEEMLNLEVGALGRGGYKVESALTAKEALSKIKVSVPDLILLDVMLPDANGREVCAELSRDPLTQHVPVILVTAQDEEADIVDGLGLGAVDYITKPFSSKVLLARVQAALRQRAANPAASLDLIQREGLTINFGRHEVIAKDIPVDLTATEFKILALLAGRPGWVFDRYAIVDGVHGADYAVSDRSVDVQIGILRKKLGEVGANIETVRGVGYRYKG